MSPPNSDSIPYDYERADFKQNLILVVRFTRNWIHYGCLLHVFVFALAAAAQGMLRPAS